MAKRNRYRIKDWAKHYEKSDSARTAKGKPLKWVAITTKHDGESLRRLGRHADGPASFCAFVLMVELAGKMPERGILENENGPLNAEAMSIKTGFPEFVFEVAFKVLREPGIDWIVREEIEYPEVSEDTFLNCAYKTLHHTTQQDITPHHQSGGGGGAEEKGGPTEGEADRGGPKGGPIPGGQGEAKREAEETGANAGDDLDSQIRHWFGGCAFVVYHHKNHTKMRNLVTGLGWAEAIALIEELHRDPRVTCPISIGLSRMPSILETRRQGGPTNTKHAAALQRARNLAAKEKEASSARK